MADGMDKAAFPDETALLDLCARKGAELKLREGRLFMKPGKTPFTGEERRHLRRRKYELMRTLLRQDNARELAASWAHWQAGWHKKPEAAQSSVVPLTPYQEIFALLTSQGEDAVVSQVGLFDLALPCPDPDGSLVQEVLQTLMARHPMLRMRVVRENEKENGVLVHDVSKSGFGLEICSTCPLPVTIVCHEDEAQREAALAASRTSLRTMTWDLGQAPLWRAAIFPHGKDCTSTLVLGLHHIIMDGWSMGLLAEDMARILESRACTKDLPDPPAVTYASFAAWLAREGLPLIRRHQSGFWAGLVQSVPQRHRLRSDYLRATMQETAGHRLCRARIVPEVAGELQRCAATRGCSLFAALHTALRLLLYRACGQTHAPILTVAANRQLPGLERVVGCLVNVLPLVCPFQPEATMEDNLRQSQSCLVQALDHQALPFQDIVAAAGVTRQKARHPLSQIFLTLQNAFSCGEQRTVTARLPEEPISAYDLALVLWDFGSEGLIAHLEYDAGLYSEEHAQALLDAYADCLALLPLALGERAGTLALGEAQASAPSETVPGETASSETSPQGTAPAERLAQMLTCAGTRTVTVILRDTAPAAAPVAESVIRLVKEACALCGCPCLPESQAAGVPGPHLHVQTHWPEETLPEDADVLLVNHLPSAQQLARARAQARRSGRLLLLLQTRPDALPLVARAQDLVSDRATHLAASTLLFSSPVTERSGLLVQDGPARGLASLGQGLVALPLPGGSSPLVWNRGHIINLDKAVEDWAHTLGLEHPDCALGFLVPAHSSLLSSVVHEEGELVAWVGRGFGDTDRLNELPDHLRPRHIMHVDHVPRRNDGTVCRKSLLDIPFYSPDFVQRALADARLEPAQRRPGDTLHVPAGDGQSTSACTTKSCTAHSLAMTSFAMPEAVADRESPLLARDTSCLVLLSDDPGLDACCLDLLAGAPCRFLLKGQTADILCARLGSAQVVPWTAAHASGPAGSGPAASGPAGCAVRILCPHRAFEPHTQGSCDGLCKGMPCLNLLVLNKEDRSLSLPDLARRFAALCEAAREHNRHAPHTCLVFALGLQTQACRACTNEGTKAGTDRTGPHAGAPCPLILLRKALACGQDMGLINLEPEDLGWHSLLLGTPRPQHELVARGAILPHCLPHPLRNAFCETGPLRMELCPSCTGEENGQAAGDRGACEDLAQTMAQTMAEIWNSVLQIENADPSANFFDLGGTSVMAPLLQERIASAFQVDIGVAGVFLYPSLQELIMVVRSQLESRQGQGSSARAEDHVEARQQAARAARNNRKHARRSYEAPMA